MQQFYFSVHVKVAWAGLVKNVNPGRRGRKGLVWVRERRKT